MRSNHSWSPAEGPGAAPEQIPTRSDRVSADGDDARPGALAAPSSGPVRTEPGGAGGEPDGKTISKPGRTALNED